uniref:NADH-ubiquinone oxidoreductase chain 1 n=1 Tax=Inocellia fujiana TaxID=1821759 RepID=A0A1S5QYM4_9NEOP|nr:NADH dehydrogenase subunit 1 [Inocellia crassicornis]AMW68007.1 NADH dehydrogenase subunit 1 [Inocellia fujiana]WBK02887.1 NADH dehydrogenase subunit 1 [Inocellia crassicornis]
MYFIDVFMVFINSLLLIICLLVGVAFLTLLERKVLGYIQIRKGPNKVGFMGLLQPFSDAIKLFSKEQTFPIYSNYLMYYFSPVLSFMLSMIVWLVMPYYFMMINFNLGILFMLCCLSMGVYGLMIAGWSSNSMYSLLGGLRAIAQTISYEISLALILMSFILLMLSFNFLNFLKYQYFSWMLMISLPLMLMWLATMLAETNRTPFDFAEGESELVSGFNVEYSSGGFALIFLAEYLSILFMSMLFVMIFMGGYTMSMMFYMKMLFISFFFLWVRGTLPRFRYDKLMYLAWKCYLPFSINMLIFYIGLKVFLEIY